MGRVSPHAVSRWSRSPGCCGFISWFVLGAAGFFRGFFFSFSLFRTHTAYCKYESTLPHVPLYYYLSCHRHALILLSNSRHSPPSSINANRQVFTEKYVKEVHLHGEANIRVPSTRYVHSFAIAPLKQSDYAMQQY